MQLYAVSGQDGTGLRGTSAVPMTEFLGRADEYLRARNGGMGSPPSAIVT